MKVYARNQPNGPSLEALRFLPNDITQRRPPGLMLFDAWTIDATNGRFTVQPGQWVVYLEKAAVQIIDPDEFIRNWQQDDRLIKCEVSLRLWTRVTDEVRLARNRQRCVDDFVSGDCGKCVTCLKRIELDELLKEIEKANPVPEV